MFGCCNLTEILNQVLGIILKVYYLYVLPIMVLNNFLQESSQIKTHKFGCFIRNNSKVLHLFRKNVCSTIRIEGWLFNKVSQ